MRRPRTPRRGNYRDNSSAAAQKNASATIFVQHGLDINTNLGEGFGPFRIEGESDILPYVTSANIACGAHAGDPSLIEAALEETRYYGLALGAHIGYPDIAGYGRREMHLSQSELRATILYQLGALSGLAKTLGFEITQVRPHGFMYRQMFHDLRIATTVARAIAEFDKWLVLIAPAGNILLQAGEKAGVRVAGEAWVDRRYDSNGNLLLHSHPKAVISNPQEILRQASNLVRNRSVMAVDGSMVKLDFQSIHLHAKIVQAKSVAEQVRAMIVDARPLTAEPFNMEEDDSRMLAYGE